MTKLYLHAATSTDTGSFPINRHGGTAPTLQGGFSPWQDGQPGADSASLQRSMDTNKGSSQTSIAITTIATTASETYYFAKWLSPPLYQSSIAANTWTLNYAIAESSLSANFIGVSSCYIYVWRPSNATNVGVIASNLTGSGEAEPTSINTEMFENETISGSAVSGVQWGDVIIFELWSRVTQASATAFTDTFYFDGSTENTGTSGTTTVSDQASYISTPENLSFMPIVLPNFSYQWVEC